MRVQRSAATLAGRGFHIKSGLVEQPHAGVVGIPKHHRHDATFDKTNTSSGLGPAFACLRQSTIGWFFREECHGFQGKARHKPTNELGIGNATQYQCQPHAIREGENLFDCDSAQKSLKPSAVMLAFQMISCVLKQVSVFHSARAGCFARPATETKIYVSYRSFVNRCAPRLHGAHEINAATRRVVFIARFQVSGASREAKPAMDTGE